MDLLTVKEIKPYFDKIKKEFQEAEELIGFTEEILTQQVHFINNNRFPDIVIENIRKKLESGFPVLERNKIDFKDAGELFYSIIEILRKKDKKAVELNKIEAYFKEHPDELQALLKNPFIEDEDFVIKQCKRLNLDVKVCSFLLLNTLKPFLIAYAAKVKDLIEEIEKWSQAICPLCGSKPVLAFLRPTATLGVDNIKNVGSERSFLCRMCNTEWKCKRIRCPFCENQDHDTLGYLFIDEDKNQKYRISICKKCKSYIKTIDIQKDISNDERYPFFIEDLLTVKIDLLAKKEGFFKPVQNTYGL